MPTPEAELERLRAANGELQGHVARLSQVQQQLIQTRDRLDRELERFGGIQSYNTRALVARTAEAFAELTAETILELFEVEVGILWLTDSTGRLLSDPSAVVGLSSSSSLSAGALEVLLGSVFGRVSSAARSGARLLTSEAEPALRALGLAEVVLCPCRGSRRLHGWILGGVSVARSAFYDPLSPGMLKSFGVFAQQVGALLENRAAQTTIAEQMERLREKEERLNMALEAGNVGLWELDIREQRIVVSETWKALLGEQGDGFGDTTAAFLGRIHPEDVAPSQTHLRAFLERGQGDYENMYRVRHREGHYVWLLARGRVLRDASGRPQRMLGTHVDVSDQKSLTEKFQAIFQHASDGYLLLDERLRVVDSNPVSRRWFGLGEGGDGDRAADLLERAMPPTQPEGPPSAATWQAHLREAQAKGHHRFPWWFRQPDGGTALLPVEVGLVRLSLGERLLLFANIHDLTERVQSEAALRRAEEEQRRAREQAEAASRAKSQFLATTSHEIRTPMNGVLGTLELLDESSLDAEQRQYVDLARRSALSLLGIIDDILDLSKVEAGRLELESRPFDPVRTLTEVVGLHRPRAAAKGLILDLHIAPALALLSSVLGDEGRLRQILSNLVGNAVKFTAQGTVTVSLTGQPRAGGTPGWELLWRVRDTGIGIPAETRDRLFQPFTQADSTTTRRFGGTGLGLAICRTLAGLMGGQIWIEDAVTAGTEFVLRIPFSLPAPQADTRPPTLSTAAAVGQLRPQGRILLVEDNAINRTVAIALIKKLSVEVQVAEDGEAAVERFRDGFTADLVLMDMQMPVMDGIEATRQIRALETAMGQPRVPIVALTANAMSEDREACLAAGMDDFLPKPITRIGLNAILERWLGSVPEASRPAPAASPAMP